MMNQNENLHDEFLKGLNKRKEEVVSEFYRTYYGACWGFAFRYLDDKKDAEDAVQDSFEKILKVKKKYISLVHLRRSLFETLRNTCLDYIKAKKRHELSHEEIRYLSEKDAEDLFTNIFLAEFREVVAREIDKLPEKQKESYTLLYVEGLSVSEIASRLNISEITVRTVKMICQNKIIEELRKEGIPIILLGLFTPLLVGS